GLVEVIIESGQPVLFNTAQESAEAGAFLIASPGSDKDLNEAFIGVPIFREGKAIGATSVQSYQQYAFNRNDLSLLQTLTNSMSVALERARLFDETQHLLQETEQHAAELSTINTVSQALIAKSDLDALINLIGEQMRQTFSADIVYVALLDRLTNVIQFPYTYGDRFDPLPLGEGLTSKILQSGEALLINREMEKRRTELGITQVGVGARSYLGVPIQRGGQTFGVISVQSTQEEGRFNESDLRLLSTIAANVSTVIRNAQLFDEIKHQKQYYETVIENSPAAIVLLDKEAAVTGWNPAAEKLFGYTEAEALGENIDNLVANADSLHAEAVRYSQKALADKQVHLLARRTRKDGSMVDVEVSGVPIQIEGQEGEFIAIYHDVSELQRAREAAEQANQAKSAFLANMSHELRTPLNAILGFTRIVKRKGAEILPEKQIENLDKVLLSADHLLGLINSVLDISKIEAGRMDVRAAAFELPSIINLVVETSQTLMREGVKLEADLPAEFPLVFTDQDKLKQILINLLSNAAKFTHQGKITIAAREASDMLYIDVSDTGIGISEEALERIFEEFQQADSSTTRVYGGTGLGLSISRRLARLLGGNLAACSIEGEGSTFTLTLPLRYKLAPTDEGSVSASAEALQAPTTDLPLILSIDDDPNVHELLKENLGERGYQVIGVCSGDEGIRLARELLPFAITLDIMMPGKDGWQVLHELKDDPATRAIPVILITIVDKQTLGYQLGAADYLVKPLEEGAVLSALQHILGHDRGDTHIHLLVVDDDPNISEMVGQLLEATPYQIEGAPDGRSALEAIRRHPPDVILLDLMMPNMDGFALIESLREEDLRIPIIVLTAKTLTAAELDILEGSVAQIIQKNGLEPEKLLTQLQTTVEQLRGRGTHA
ncbi:MAG: response regulator, partial [Anaerolineales bacterium]